MGTLDRDTKEAKYPPGPSLMLALLFVVITYYKWEKYSRRYKDKK